MKTHMGGSRLWNHQLLLPPQFFHRVNTLTVVLSWNCNCPSPATSTRGGQRGVAPFLVASASISDARSLLVQPREASGVRICCHNSKRKYARRFQNEKPCPVITHCVVDRGVGRSQCFRAGHGERHDTRNGHR